jgi:hypothetical protein
MCVSTVVTVRTWSAVFYKYTRLRAVEPNIVSEVQINGSAAAAFPPPGGGTARRGVLAGGHEHLPLP